MDLGLEFISPNKLISSGDRFFSVLGLSIWKLTGLIFDLNFFNRHWHTAFLVIWEEMCWSLHSRFGIVHLKIFSFDIWIWKFLWRQWLLIWEEMFAIVFICVERTQVQYLLPKWLAYGGFDFTGKLWQQKNTGVFIIACEKYILSPKQAQTYKYIFYRCNHSLAWSLISISS